MNIHLTPASALAVVEHVTKYLSLPADDERMRAATVAILKHRRDVAADVLGTSPKKLTVAIGVITVTIAVHHSFPTQLVRVHAIPALRDIWSAYGPLSAGRYQVGVSVHAGSPIDVRSGPLDFDLAKYVTLHAATHTTFTVTGDERAYYLHLRAS